MGGHSMATRRLYSKSRIGGLGYAEVPQISPNMAAGSANGHAAFVAGTMYDDVISGCGPSAMQSSSYRSLVTSGSRFPHILGYFETDGRVRKDCKSGLHHSVEKLRESIVRMTSSPPSCGQVREIHHHNNSRPGAEGPDAPTAAGGSGGRAGGDVEATGAGSGYRIPRSWVSMLKSLADVSRHRGGGSTASWFPPGSTSPLPFVVVDDLKALARKCDIPLSQV